MMAALRYLHGLNILFNYDEEGALPGVVFVNGQVLLDKITELVEKSHQLRDNPSCVGWPLEVSGRSSVATPS